MIDEEEAWIREQEEMAGLHDAKRPAAPPPASSGARPLESPGGGGKCPPVIEIDSGSSQGSTQAYSPAPAPEVPVNLSPEQKAVLRHVMEGKNVYFTGSAGCGKSTLLREIIKRSPYSKTFVTASTGMAALNIGGTTVHSFAGIGLGDGSESMLIDKALRGRTSRANWELVEVLVIDEISMIHGSLLTKLEAIARAAKNNSRPFGGIQLIVTGDFFQLPPVQKDRRQGEQSDFCFNAPIWETLFPRECCFELSTIFRQAESQLVDLLQDVRYGHVSDNSIALLRQLRRELKPPEGIVPTLLFSTNRKVDAINREKLARLPGQVHTYRSQDEGQEPYLSQMRKNCLAEDELVLKKDAQVMLIKNIDPGAGLVNGTKGCVIGFAQDEKAGMEFPVVRFSNGNERVISYEEWTVEQPKGNRVETVAVRSQVPLKLGYAITVHKSQGMGLEWCEVSLEAIFEEGQGYVALSRAIKLDGLRVLDFNPSRFKVSREVVAFYDRVIKGRTQQEFGDESTWKGTPLWSGNDSVASQSPCSTPGSGGGKAPYYSKQRSDSNSFNKRAPTSPFDAWSSNSTTKRRALQSNNTEAGSRSRFFAPVSHEVPKAQSLATEASAPGPWGGFKQHAVRRPPPPQLGQRATPGGQAWAMYDRHRGLPVYKGTTGTGSGRGGGGATYSSR